jgi:hypothetical protein
MVWLYRSPIPVGRRGVISSFKDFYLPWLRVEGGGGRVDTQWPGAHFLNIFLNMFLQNIKLSTKANEKRFIVFHRNTHFTIERCDKSHKSIFAKMKKKHLELMWKQMLPYRQFGAVKFPKKFHVQYII